MKRSSLSLRTLVQPSSEKEKNLASQLRSISPLGAGKDGDPFPPQPVACRSFSIQLEEIKSSRKKSWGFSQVKAADNVVVMFPNPTFDDTISMVADTEMTTSHKDIGSNPGDLFYHEKASLPSACAVIPPAINSPRPLEARSRPKEKTILKPIPYFISAGTPMSKPQSSSKNNTITATGRDPSKKSKWLRTVTSTPSPTLIRRLPDVHEMNDIKPKSAFNAPRDTQDNSFRSRNAEDGMQPHGDADDSSSRWRNVYFGNPLGSSDVGPTSTNVRRPSLVRTGIV